jgi:hypothetical protein
MATNTRIGTLPVPESTSVLVMGMWPPAGDPTIVDAPATCGRSGRSDLWCSACPADVRALPRSRSAHSWEQDFRISEALTFGEQFTEVSEHLLYASAFRKSSRTLSPAPARRCFEREQARKWSRSDRDDHRSHSIEPDFHNAEVSWVQARYRCHLHRASELRFDPVGRSWTPLSDNLRVNTVHDRR